MEAIIEGLDDYLSSEVATAALTGESWGGSAFAWLHGFRRVPVRYDRRVDMHEAMLPPACCPTCSRRLWASL